MMLSTRTEWSVETTGTIHVLPVFRLLLLQHTVNIVSRNFGLLGATEAGEAHRLPHRGYLGIFIDIHRISVLCFYGGGGLFGCWH